MGLFSQIREDLIKALKQKDALVLETLRMVSASFNNEKIAQKKEAIDDKACLKILNQEAKKRKDSIQAFKKGGRQDLADKEKKEIEIIQQYLPQQLSEEAATDKIKKIIAGNSKLEFGPLMGKVMAELKGQADGNLVQKIVKQEISS